MIKIFLIVSISSNFVHIYLYNLKNKSGKNTDNIEKRILALKNNQGNTIWPQNKLI